MRRLIIMRHAKSAWSGGEPDHERPLNERGRRDAPRVAAALRESGWTPDCVILSDSQRTRQTWDRMEPEFDGVIPARATSDLYLAGLGALQHQVEGLSHAVRTVLVLGHNPGWEVAVSVLSGTPTSMPTAAAALLELGDLPWELALHRPGQATLVQLILPKALPRAD